MRIEKDDKKPKVTARKMINMMMAINKDNFEAAARYLVTLAIAARGNPVATPIPHWTKTPAGSR